VLNSECSGHLGDELVDELLSVTVGTVSLTERVSLDLESTEWGGELEWPEEVVGFLELWSAGDDLVDEVLDAVDTVLSEFTSDDAVVGEWDSGSVDLTVASLVDELGDGLSGWVTEGNVWLDDSDHVPGGLVELHKHAIVQLSESHKLQDFLWLWSELVNTLDSDKESNLGLTLDEEVSSLLGLSLSVNECLVSGSVLFSVFFGVF